jgi:flagellar biosynthetic protein FliR
MGGALSLAIPYFYLAHVMVVSIRVGAALLFAPIWGYPGIPQTFRILLVFALSVGIAAVVPVDPAMTQNPGLVIPGEILIGMLLTMSIRIAFAGLHMGGQLLSYYLGFSQVQSIDPNTQNRSTLMSGFLSLLGYVLILASDQHHAMLRAIRSSYTAFPMGSVVQTNQWFSALINATSQIFVIGWQIALPVFIATLLIDVTVGLVSRSQPQLSSMIVTAPLKLLIGMTVLGASLSYLPRVFEAAMNMQILHK